MNQQPKQEPSSPGAEEAMMDNSSGLTNLLLDNSPLLTDHHNHHHHTPTSIYPTTTCSHHSPTSAVTPQTLLPSASLLMSEILFQQHNNAISSGGHLAGGGHGSLAPVNQLPNLATVYLNQSQAMASQTHSDIADLLSSYHRLWLYRSTNLLLDPVEHRRFLLHRWRSRVLASRQNKDEIKRNQQRKLSRYIELCREQTKVKCVEVWIGDCTTSTIFTAPFYANTDAEVQQSSGPLLHRLHLRVSWLQVRIVRLGLYRSKLFRRRKLFRRSKPYIHWMNA